MDIFRDITLVSVTLRILAALLLGGFMGIERGMKNRSAGLRTHMLVCLGACMVMLTNQYATQLYGSGDPVRMGAQVVSGIGFLGAGTIVVTRRNQIRGLTTAAGLWAAACMGLVVGIGFYELAAVGGIAIFLVLSILHKIDNYMRKSVRVVEIYAELGKDTSLGKFMRFTRENGITATNLQIEHDDVSEDRITAFIVTLEGERDKSHNEVIQTVRGMEGMSYIEEL